MRCRRLGGGWEMMLMSRCVGALQRWLSQLQKHTFAVTVPDVPLMAEAPFDRAMRGDSSGSMLERHREAQGWTDRQHMNG